MHIDHSTIMVGYELPTFTRVPGYDQFNRFAAVNDEFVPWHMDDEAGREAGFPGAIGMGRLTWSYLHNALRDWIGDCGRILIIDAEFRSPQLRNEPATARAVITTARDEPGRKVIDLDLNLHDSSGKILVPGTATVALTCS